jgi:hypothetical protein
VGFSTLSPEFSLFLSQVFVTSLPRHMSQMVLFAEQLSTVFAFLEFAEFFSARCAFGQLSAPIQLDIDPRLKVSLFAITPQRFD